MIICNRDKNESDLIEKYIYEYYKNKKITIFLKFCKDWQELRELLKREEPDVVIIAQNGVEGLDIITGMKIISGKLIWFSDLDFGLQAYRLCVSYFNMKPVSYDKVAYALDYVDLD
ncbi:MAG: hypothetical protein ACLR9T_07380 [Thomasclavelia sp.]|uniref:hypothetical protein n=1 Tax=Thomasclavelia sp. TaxID=3025757 RepID=UPI00399FC7AC